ncbi:MULTISPECIES: NlpC/P60 family protein [Actinomadura]|uniref:Cell wall-associated hydrolase, NlpC family n=2 Tax=Actinomadura madurae TaxID=1993 RepID=A0A1I5D7Q3_9ACTN|nr:C40 family peptidase [Actinomadura madurae]SFN95275.1 Cell wall-associated hydrolase, NlpC family [Actinomadura madurae]SPT50428.1 Probable endopeptidase cgR_2070 precursor [Actinomadura madurae]
MAPDPRRWRRITPATAATLLLIGLGAAAPVTAHAAQPFRLAAAPSAPSPTPTTEKGLRKSLDALNEEAEILTEKYNKTRVDFGKARKAEQAAAQEARRLRALAEPARQQLGRMAAANYMAGGPDVIFGAGGSAEGLSDRAYLAQNQATAVLALKKQIDQADAAQRTAEARTAQVRKAWEDAKKARAAAKTKVAEVMKRLDKLTTTHVRDPRSGLTATVKGSGLPAKMARKALTKLGSPYVWAAAGPNSFDCSGLVVWAYAQVGKSGLPHYTGDLFGLGTKVSRGALRSGDLVYFGSNLHHMGIYLGGGKYLHAPQTGDVVKISNMSDRSDYAGANRIS